MSVIANNTSKLNPQTGIGNVSVVHCIKNNSEMGRKIPNKKYQTRKCTLLLLWKTLWDCKQTYKI